ncbi:MAG: nuclear transport factor 2 family protein [Thermoleophilaceae bacterium]|nr:nuclear transport factor 2 family protein [Thermoleophilaceae bacterium]
MQTTSTEIKQLAERYGAAWNDHDLDTIMEMHAEDSVFELSMDGAEVKGVEAIRQAFTGIFAMWPDIHFETRRLYSGENLFVHEYTITATLAQPLPLGEMLIQPTGNPVQFNGVDVISIEDGLVQRKDTYLDLVAAQRQFGLLSG